MPGPIPNREADLARPRSRKGGESREVTRGTAKPVIIPRVNAEWHPIARRVWESLKASGQSDFYQQSDWAMAYSLCDDLSYYKQSGKRSGQMLQTIYSAFAALGMMEGDRRRMALELDAPAGPETSTEDAAETAYRSVLSVVPGGAS